MPITPGRDKNELWRRVRGDPEVQRLLGIEGLGDDVAAQHIVKQREIQEPLTQSSRVVCIFDVPGVRAVGPYVQSMIEIDVLTPADRQHIADEILERIIWLFHRWRVNGRPVEIEAQLGNIACANGFYRCGVRFSFYSSVGYSPQQLRFGGKT